MKVLINFSKILMFSLIFSISTLAQTSNDLSAKFGLPSSETYQVNPNVLLSVKYGKDDQLCWVGVTEKYTSENKQNLFGLRKEGEKTEKTAQDVHSEIMQSLSPALKFGKLIKDGGTNTGNCFTRHLAEYENVFTVWENQICGQTPQCGFSIQWKRKECDGVTSGRFLF